MNTAATQAALDEVRKHQENRPVRTRNTGFPPLNRHEFKIATYARRQAINDVIGELTTKLNMESANNGENSTI